MLGNYLNLTLNYAFAGNCAIHTCNSVSEGYLFFINSRDGGVSGYSDENCGPLPTNIAMYMALVCPRILVFLATDRIVAI